MEQKERKRRKGKFAAKVVRQGQNGQMGKNKDKWVCEGEKYIIFRGGSLPHAITVSHSRCVSTCILIKYIPDKEFIYRHMSTSHNEPAQTPLTLQ